LAELSNRLEDESGQQSLAGKEARSFWMMPVGIAGADSYHRNHFGWTVEISDLGSWFENGFRLRVRTCQQYPRIRSIDSDQPLAWEQEAVFQKCGPRAVIYVDWSDCLEAQSSFEGLAKAW
jgi:hypothetical protein